MEMQESGEREVGTRERSNLHGEKLLLLLLVVVDIYKPKGIKEKERDQDLFVYFYPPFYLFLPL